MTGHASLWRANQGQILMKCDTLRPIPLRWILVLPLLVAAHGQCAAGEQMLVTSSRAGNADLFLIDVETGDTFNLTRHPAFDAYPAWSHDGKRIAYSSQRERGIHLFLIDADGGNPTQLTDEESVDRAPTFSPDGKKLAFSRRAGGEAGTNVWVIDADGRGAKVLQENAFDPAWSPDGKRIAFTSIRDGANGFRLFVMNADGSQVQPLTTQDNPIGFVYPAWSPDGRHIAYSELYDEHIEIATVDVDGRNGKRLTTLMGLNTYAAWSPDGKRIAFQHHEANRQPGPVYVMQADGSNPTVIQVLSSERYAEGGRHLWKPQ